MDPLQQTAFELFESFEVFITLIILSFAMLGIWARSLAVGSFLGYLAFAHIAVETQEPLLINILYVTATLVFVGMGFKLWRAEFGGT